MYLMLSLIHFLHIPLGLAKNIILSLVISRFVLLISVLLCILLTAFSFFHGAITFIMCRNGVL